MDAAHNQGIKTAAVLTTMDTPIGMAIGNSLEVMEVIETLKGKGPADLLELVKVQGKNNFLNAFPHQIIFYNFILFMLACTSKGGQLLYLAGRTDLEQGEMLIEKVLQNGTALACFEKMLVHQNVDSQLAADLCSGKKRLAVAKHITPILAASSGKSKLNLAN